MSHKHFIQCYVILSLVILAGASKANAEETDPNIWDRLTTVVENETKKFQGVLKNQQQMNAEEQTLLEQLDHSRRMRVMHREAVLISALNVAWIHDELKNWDCRIAEQKAREVKERIAELSVFGKRIDSICSGLGDNVSYQQQACESQRTQMTQSMTELERLGKRYEASCPLSRDINTGEQQ